MESSVPVQSVSPELSSSHCLAKSPMACFPQGTDLSQDCDVFPVDPISAPSSNVHADIPSFEGGASVSQILANQPRVVVEDISLSSNAGKLKGLNKPGNPHSLSSHLY